MMDGILQRTDGTVSRTSAWHMFSTSAGDADASTIALCAGVHAAWAPFAGAFMQCRHDAECNGYLALVCPQEKIKG